MLNGLQAPTAVDMRAGLPPGEVPDMPGQGEDSVDAPFEGQREQANPPVNYSHPEQVGHKTTFGLSTMLASSIFQRQLQSCRVRL